MGTECPAIKVYREPRTFKGRFGPRAHLSLARGEYEAVQVVLYPVSRGKGNGSRTFRCEMTDLKGPAGEIKKSEVEISQIGYVHPHQLYYGQDYAGAHPDPLWPSPDYVPGTVVANEGELQPLWAVLHAPPGTPAGDYEGRLRLYEGKQRASEVKIGVHVWNFTLPEEMHLPAVFDFYDIRATYPKRPGESIRDWRARLQSLEKRYYVDMLTHRISPMRNLGYPGFTGAEGGRLTFDFSEFDKRYQFYMEQLHQPRFAVAPEWPDWGTARFERWKPEGWIGFRSAMTLKGTFRAIGEHLEKKGWIEKAYVYSIDEHPGEWTKQINALIHQGHPRIKNLMTLMVQEGYRDVDIWCPRMYELTPGNLALGRKFQREGKEFWIYTSGPSPPFPTLMLDWDLVNCRIIPWMCWKFGLDGYLYWCINFWIKNPWEATETFEGQNGGGVLYYPGKNGPVGTLRLEAFRDGLEDYEYLWLLRECVKKLEAHAAPPDQETLAAAKHLITVDDSLVKYFDDFTNDAHTLQAMRVRIAEQIERLTAMGHSIARIRNGGSR